MVVYFNVFALSLVVDDGCEENTARCCHSAMVQCCNFHLGRYIFYIERLVYFNKILEVERRISDM